MKIAASLAWVVVVVLQLLTLHSLREETPEIGREISLKLEQHDQLIPTPRNQPPVADSELLQSFLSGIRRDGFIAHAAEKRKIDSLSANFQEISALLDVYVAEESPDEVRQARREFHAFAAAWQVRENSILGLYLVGGDLPSEPLVLPQSLRDAFPARNFR